MIKKVELQANKGEWSELYVLFKIFYDKFIAAAGPNLNPLDDKKYTFLKIYREETAGKRYEYNLEELDKVKILDSNGQLIKVLDSKNLNTKTKYILKAITEADSPSFILEDIGELLDEYLIHKVKANSSQKTDILAVIPDKIGTDNGELGFSIKSHIGGAPTLVNSSSHTNFVYEINGCTDEILWINSIIGASKVRKRLIELKKIGATLKLQAISSNVFNSNLRLADTAFPAILSCMLLDYYCGEGSDWKTLT